MKLRLPKRRNDFSFPIMWANINLLKRTHFHEVLVCLYWHKTNHYAVLGFEVLIAVVMKGSVDIKSTDVSQEHAAYILRVEE
jgi:hypothetical protein